MLIRYCLISFFPVFITASSVYSQEDEKPYKNEYVIAADLNTNAGLIGGLMFRQARLIKNNQYRTLSIELVNVKHPKEQKATNASTGNTFLYHKSNYLIPIRFQYGRKIILFHKAPEEGVEVSAVFAGGPTIGCIKPYFIQYDYTDYTTTSSTVPVDVRQEQYSSSRNSVDSRILGSAGFTKGLTHTKILPGINLKSGLCFELGKFGGNVTGVEVGGLLELFPKKVILIPEAQNRAVFSSVYINLYFGLRQ
jgi:hypothetical protein